MPRLPQMKVANTTEAQLKQCRKCGVSKPLENFPRHGGSADGRRARCKPCHAADVRDWTQAKPERLERVRLRVRAWVRENRERHRVNQRTCERKRRDDPECRRRAREREHRYRQKNSKKRAAAYRRWVQDNPERSRARNRKWAERHRDKAREKTWAWRLANPDKAKALWRANKARRRARQLEAPGKTTRVQLQARWDYYGGRCGMCGREAESIDHVIPLARGGANWPSNLRPACMACNMRKGANRPQVAPSTDLATSARAGGGAGTP